MFKLFLHFVATNMSQDTNMIENQTLLEESKHELREAIKDQNADITDLKQCGKKLIVEMNIAKVQFNIYANELRN